MKYNSIVTDLTGDSGPGTNRRNMAYDQAGDQEERLGSVCSAERRRKRSF